MQLLLRVNRTAAALCVNAVILLLILLAITTRDGRVLPGSMAWGQSMPTAPATGITIMPGQLAANVWGCYVMDPQNQTLSVYQYSPADHILKLEAARDIQYDRRLTFFNTSPSPLEIKARLEDAEQPSRAAPTTNRSPEVNGDR